MYQSQTKGKAVADRLLNYLRDSKAQPGSRLKSVRILAEEYEVSTQSITSAFEILEKARIIERRARSGVFVRNSYYSTNTEIGIFCNVVNQTNEYQQMIFKLTGAPYRDPEFNFTIRTATLGNFGVDMELLRMELESFIDKNNLDCLLINMPTLTQEGVELCNGLRIPVIFLGDFQYPEKINTACHQIKADNFEGGYQAVVTLFQLSGNKRLVLLIAASDSFFYREYLEGARQAAKENYLELNIIEIFGTRKALIPESEVPLFFDRAIEKIQNLDCGDAVFFNLLDERLSDYFSALNLPYINQLYRKVRSKEQICSFCRDVNSLVHYVLDNEKPAKRQIVRYNKPEILKYSQQI